MLCKKNDNSCNAPPKSLLGNNKLILALCVFKRTSYFNDLLELSPTPINEALESKQPKGQWNIIVVISVCGMMKVSVPMLIKGTSKILGRWALVRSCLTHDHTTNVDGCERLTLDHRRRNSLQCWIVSPEKNLCIAKKIWEKKKYK